MIINSTRATLITDLDSAVVRPVETFFAPYIAQLQSYGSQTLLDLSNVRTSLLNIPSLVQNTFSGIIPFLTDVRNEIVKGAIDVQNFVLGTVIPRLDQIPSQVLAAARQVQMEASAILTPTERAITDFLGSGGPNLEIRFRDPIFKFLSNVQNQVKQTIIALLPRTPDAAFNAALIVAETGIGLYVVGQVEALLVEAVYPTKHLGITEAVKDGLSLLGITQVSASLYAIIVESGFRERLKQYFNFQLQPHKIDALTSQRAVWYLSRTTDQYRTDLKYEGFEDDYIGAKVATLYQPLPPRMLATFTELGLAPTAFVEKHLRRHGADPEDIVDIIKFMQYLPLKAFEAQARSVIYNARKEGIVNDKFGNALLDAFGVPKVQKDWIFRIADLDYQLEQAKLVKDLILQEVIKGNIKAEDAVNQIQELGYTESRAALYVRLTALKAAPKLSKDDLTKLVAEVFGITPLVV